MARRKRGFRASEALTPSLPRDPIPSLLDDLSYATAQTVAELRAAFTAPLPPATTIAMRSTGIIRRTCPGFSVRLSTIGTWPGSTAATRRSIRPL